MQNVCNSGTAAMDLQENSGEGLSTASTSTTSPVNDQNNYAAKGITNDAQETFPNSTTLQSSSRDHVASLPESQDSMNAHSSTYRAQQECNKSENDLPEGDRSAVQESIFKDDEMPAVSKDTASALDGPKAEENISEQNKARTDEKPPEVATKKRICDIVRVQKVLEELSAKHSGPDQGSGVRYKRQKISNDARSLILEYAKELSSAILEESCLLAKHRNSKELITADIKLIFGT